MPFLLLLLVIPLLEVAAFIAVGREIGIVATLLLLLAAGAAGTLLLRVQGLTTLMRARTRLAAGEPPVAEAFDGICLALAGVLLVLPGFLSDLMALLLLLPPVRRWLRGRVAARAVAAGAGRARRYGNVTVIEGDWVETGRPPEPDRTLPGPGPSRWGR
jgi:UPF0716 protein FxsA